MIKSQCPSCGASVPLKSVKCSYCGSVIYNSSDKDDTKVFNQLFFNVHTNIPTANGCVSPWVNYTYENLKSIQDIVNNYKPLRVPISSIASLNLSNNKLSDLKGIENFSSLSYIDVSNNPIETLDGEVIDYFITQIKKTPLLVWGRSFLSGNFYFKLKDTSLDLGNLLSKIEVIDLNSCSEDELNLSFFENELLSIYLHILNNCKRDWDFSEKSKELKKAYSSLKEYQLSKTTKERRLIKNELNIAFKDESTNHIKVWFDINPNDYGFKYYSALSNAMGGNYHYYKKISLPSKNKFYSMLKSKYGIDLVDIQNSASITEKPKLKRKWWQF